MLFYGKIQYNGKGISENRSHQPSPAQFACVGLVLTLGKFSASALKAHTGQTGRLHGELSVHYRQDFLPFLRGNTDAFQCLPNAAVRANGRLVVRSGKCRNTGVGFSAKWADCRNWLIRFHGSTPPVRWCPRLSAGVSGQSRTGGIRPHRCGCRQKWGCPVSVPRA